MKRYILGATLLSLCSFGGIADAYVDQCYLDNNCCTNGVDLYGDWIFWRTRTCKLDYAIPRNSSTNSIGNVRSPSPDYDSGFRIGVAKDCNCWIAGAEYTFYRTSADDTFRNANGEIAGTHILDDFSVLSQGSDIVFANSNWNLDYDVVRLTLGRDLLSNECLNFRFISGVNFAFIDQEFKNLYTNNEDLTAADQVYSVQKISMDAYGASVGFSSDFRLSSCLSFCSALSCDVYASKNDRSLNYMTATSGNPLETVVNLKDNCWGAVSTLNVALAVAFTKQELICSRGDFSVVVGYEFHNWLNAPGFLEHQSESGEITFDRYNESLGFDGLFVRLKATF